MFTILLSIIVPTFGIIFIGWLSRHVGIWEKSSVKVLNNYAYYIALPALMFQSLLRGEIGKTIGIDDLKLIGGVLLAHGFVFLIMLTISAFPKTSRELRATAPMLTTLGNTAYLGIPFATYAFGDQGTAYASLLSVALLIVFIFASLATLNRWGKPEGETDVFKRILELPFLWAVSLGFLWSFLSLPELPLFLSRFLDILASSAGPTALLGLGTFLYDVHIEDLPWWRATILSSVKVFFPSLLCFFLLRFAGVTGVPLAVGVALGGVSTAVTTFVLSTQYRIGERLTAGTILVSTMLSLVTLSIVSFLWIGTTVFQ